MTTEESEPFELDYGWSKFVTGRDMLAFEKKMGFPYEDCYRGVPKVFKDDEGVERFAMNADGGVVREITLEVSLAHMWILKRTQDPSITYEDILDLPADVIYAVWAKRLKEFADQLAADAKKSEEQAKKASPRKTRKKSGDSSV